MASDDLLDIPVWNLVKDKGNVPVVKDTDTIGDLLEVFKKIGSSLLPVVNEHGQFVDVISILDFLAIVNQNDKHIAPSANSPGGVDDSAGEALLNLPVKKAIAAYSLRGKNPSMFIVPDTKLKDIVLRYVFGRHYLLVGYETEPHEARLLGKKDVIAYLYANRASLNPTFLTTKARHICSPAVWNIRTTDTGAAAVSAIFEHKVFGVGIVDESGHPVGNFSTSDIIEITAENFRKLALPVMEYLHDVGRDRAPVTVSKTATLEEVLQLVVERRIHRVFVVDESGLAVGVITLSTILKLL